MQSDLYNFNHVGYLKGHADWVTSIITNQDQAQTGEVVVSASRDKSIIIWKLNADGESAGQPRKQLKGHSHFISDLSLSNENNFLLSASWDHDLRLWELSTGNCTSRFIGNEKEVFSVTFSPDNRQIISGGAERKLKLFNTKGELKFTQTTNLHTDWISQIRFSPLIKNINPYIVSVGWDGWLKIWNQNQTLRYQFKAHDSQINCVAIDPSGQLIATGGRDRKVHIWNITDLKKPAFTYDAGSPVTQVTFHPNKGWIAAGTEKGINIWQINEDRESKAPFVSLDNKIEVELANNVRKTKIFGCSALVFDTLGTKLYGGFTDGRISVWEITHR